MNKTTNRTIDTVWEIWIYDVWGNAEDGFEVNDRYCRDTGYELTLPVELCNVGTPQQFECATPTRAQLLEMWGVSESDGNSDDTHLYFVGKHDYPLGEMICVSHKSLRPIEKAD